MGAQPALYCGSFGLWIRNAQFLLQEVQAPQVGEGFRDSQHTAEASSAFW